jgi:hypothetical protein
MTTQLNGQFDLSSAQEAVALPNTTDVASFSDANLTDTASAFMATIDWGDGTTTTGTVVGSNGSFSVEGGHTYADEAFENASVTIVRTADSSQLVLSATVPVDDTDTLNGQSAPTIVGNPNQALTNVTVATFTDSNTANVASDFTTSIDWGDGTTTTGTLSGSGGTFTVTGSHTYTTAGDFTITTFMNDDFPDAATAVATTTAAMGFGGTETLQSATETVALASGTQVATFVDNSGLPVSDYTATINWGDGTTTTGTITGSSGSFTVTSGGHTYADEGLFTLTANITRTTDNAMTSASGTVAVADADVLNASGTTLHGSPNLALTGVTLATFSDTITANVASDFIATINWGDGTTDTGTISGSAGAFTVSGSHTYAQNGKDTITVDVNEDPAPGVPTTSAEATSTAIIGVAPGTGNDFSVLEGTPIASGTQVATFLDGNNSDTAAAFTASINWGDGTTDTGTVSGSNGSFTVTTGGHTYADEAVDTITTTVTRTADHEQAAMTGQATVGEADSFIVTADNFGGNPGQPINNVPVATFTTPFTGNVAGDFTASINWGDGTTAAGTVSGGSGSFTVTGSHTYTSGGNDTFTVTVHDDAPSTATGTGSGTATINLAGQMVLTSAAEAMTLPNGTAVATFSDSNGGDTPASFMATINWGDGATTAGTVVGSGGSFTVEGGHTYADEGSDQASVTVTRTSDQAQATFSGSVAVAEHDVLSSQGGGVTLHGSQASIAATFSDTDMVNVAGDFTSTIDWGDGTTITGTVSGGNGSFTVNGSHTYASSNAFVATVKLTDDAPGTASSSLSVAVNPPPPSGTTAVMIMHQPSTGNYEIYDLGQNTVLAAHALTTIPAPWHVVGLGSFSGSDASDMMLRNTATGSFEIVDVSNNMASAPVLLGNVGLDWQVAGFGDFSSRSGETDMLMRNSNSGNFELYDISNNMVTSAIALGNVGLDWQVLGFGDFSGRANETDMLMRNSNTGMVELYEFSNNAVTSATLLGSVGLEFQFAGAGDFSSRPSETDLLMRNSNNGNFELYDFQNGQVTSATALGNVGLDWTVAGFGDISGNPNETDMLMRNSSTGNFELYDFRNNAVTSASLLGNVGLDWVVDGIAPAQLSSSFTPEEAQSASASSAAPDPVPAGWLTQAMQTSQADSAGWLTQQMQTGISSNGAPVAGTSGASGPGFDASSDLAAGTAPVIWAAPNPLQNHTA